MTQINTFGVAAVWVEVNLALTEMNPPQTPLSFLGRPQAYQQEFDQMQHRLKVHEEQPLTTPWPRSQGQNFWTYYLGGKTNANVTGREAWHHVVPLRAEMPLVSADAGDSNRFTLFFYPHAVAFIASVFRHSPDPLSLSDWVGAASAVRRDRLYELEWNGDNIAFFQGANWNPPYPTLTLNQLADTALDVGRQIAFGAGVGEGQRMSRDPFTVVTPYSGTGVNLLQSPAANSDIQRALHAITGWSRIGQGVNLELNDTVNVGLGKYSGNADLLYGQRRGRAVWYPTRFSVPDEDRNLAKLGCYHRNLTLLSMQTESMCGLAVALMDRRAAGDRFTPYQRELARHAGGAVGRLYGGKRGLKTYRSYSSSQQIDDNQWVTAVNLMREQISDSYMVPLHK